MAEKVKTNLQRLLRRQCVVCGYDGALLRGGRAQRCARCGCDLRERPARSYAEMEGLIGQPIRIAGSASSGREIRSRIIERWLMVTFFFLVGVVVVAWLVEAALHP